MNKYLTLINELNLLINDLTTKIQANNESEIADSISSEFKNKLLQEYQSDLDELNKTRETIINYPSLIKAIKKKHQKKFFLLDSICSLASIALFHGAIFLIGLSSLPIKIIGDCVFIFLFTLLWGFNIFSDYLEESAHLRTLNKNYTLAELNKLIQNKTICLEKISSEIATLKANLAEYQDKGANLTTKRDDLMNKLNLAKNKYATILELPEVESVINAKFNADLTLKRILQKKEDNYE